MTVCKKARYTRWGAVRALMKIDAKRSNPNRKENRSYWCAKCKAYHLTSKVGP